MTHTKSAKTAVYKAQNMLLFVAGKEIKTMVGHEFEF